MNRKACVTAVVAGLVVAVGTALALVLLLPSGPAAAGATSQTGVCSALRQSLDSAGVPVTKVVPYETTDFTSAYTVVCSSVPTQDPINVGITFQQAAILAGTGLPVGALRIQCVDTSGVVVLETTQLVRAAQVNPGEVVDSEGLSALQSSLGRELDTEASSAAPAIRRQGLSVTKDAAGPTKASVAFVATDAAAAKKAIDNGLVQAVAQSCRSHSGDTGSSINAVTITISDVNGKPLLNYFEDLDTGSIHAYHAPEIGMGWAPTSEPRWHG
jgi:hypothetical protein